MWKIKDGKLEAEFQFTNYNEAVGFINHVSDIANEQNHHPDIFLHEYKKVKVYLVTHDAGYEITDIDYKMSEEIERMYKKYFWK